MRRKDRPLVIVLWLLGVSMLLAMFAVVMPMDWMASIHRWLDLGEMPQGPIVAYLARSLSLFYAVSGVMCLLLASDVERYRPLIRRLALLMVPVGGAMLGIDLTAPMPTSWTTGEGPPLIVIALLVFYLAGRGEAD